MRFLRCLPVFMLCALVAAGPAHAQPGNADWPPKLIKLVVPFAAGGSTDLLARKIAEELAQRVKTTVIVDNRPGAGGTLGSEWVSQQPADGSVLLMGSVSTHAVAPSLYA